MMRITIDAVQRKGTLHGQQLTVHVCQLAVLFESSGVNQQADGRVAVTAVQTHPLFVVDHVHDLVSLLYLLLTHLKVCEGQGQEAHLISGQQQQQQQAAEGSL
jgi:hypothetical protein